MYSNQPSVSPVKHVVRFLILGGEFGAGAEDNAGRAADADVDDSGQTVEVVFGPLGGAFAEAAVVGAGGVEDADRAIPGRAPVPFHVAVEIHAGDESAGRHLAGAKAVAVFGPRERQIVGVILVWAGRRQVFGNLG